MTGIGKSRKTTIYDLAELSGVSASAVSAILNGNWKKRRISAKLAEKVTRIAQEQGYAVNRQASLLRSSRSKIIGMIVPKYDNRYFGSIVETFEAMARERGLFPIITCTRRDPELELEAARTMLSWQVDWLIATGATDPDKITGLCAASGVPTLNLDLPGTLAPSVISDNYMGAKELTRRILLNSEKRYGEKRPLVFVGGRGSDHNTRERLRGFRDAHHDADLALPEENMLACGYAPQKAELALHTFFAVPDRNTGGLFVNSTISLEGVVRWLTQSAYRGQDQPPMGCFDWDPFVTLLGHDIEMVRQDVPAMLAAVFEIIDAGDVQKQQREIPPIFVS
ncbi:LacI family transcriptional regulator [Superficieibacter electus]|uniref:LacI family transcriptional regulator n=1 Tax=Superficieibacter electus TaxID=2022662 RepID=A0A2P5GW26_9ENTR|nr:LacI family DNA-binding transcriptional regulator [Superficieibacter electus]POP50768.1 LacI family transcriptional regulator [Superficieibacter electus]